MKKRHWTIGIVGVFNDLFKYALLRVQSDYSFHLPLCILNLSLQSAPNGGHIWGTSQQHHRSETQRIGPRVSKSRRRAALVPLAETTWFQKRSVRGGEQVGLPPQCCPSTSLNGHPWTSLGTWPGHPRGRHTSVRGEKKSPRIALGHIWAQPSFTLGWHQSRGKSPRHRQCYHC